MVRKTIVFTSFLAILTWLSLSAFKAAYVNRACARAAGHLAPRNNWPAGFLEIIDHAGRNHLPMTRLRVYYGDRDDYYLKCDASPQLLDLMSADWKLKPVNQGEDAIRFVLAVTPPELWDPGSTSGARFFVSMNWLTNDGGDLYSVMYDKTNNEILVRYYYSF